MTPRTIETVPIEKLKPDARNARTHSPTQIRQLAKAIEKFSFTNPVLVDDDLNILAGHGRLEAAKLLKMEEVPVIRLSGMSEADKRAYIIADNRLAENAGWDKGVLAQELQILNDLDFDLSAVGFEPPQLDAILSFSADADPNEANGPEDAPTPLAASAVTRLGDVWTLGRHRLVCGDARDPDAYRSLMQDERAQAIFTDPPYNVPVGAHVRVGGDHREFAMASGEMTKAEFSAFLKQTLSPAAAACQDGALSFVCMDWRHMAEMLEAGEAAFSEFKSLCVWTKTNGGMGSLYRSQHELVFVFKVGDAEHINNVQLGKNGRNRTTVWPYAGVNAFKTERDEELSMHPTVKPVALVEDAIKDVTNRNHIVLDPFGGSGTTLIAAEKCGRKARVIEIDPLYCDVILRRYAKFTGKQPLLASGETFERVEDSRRLS